MKESYIKKLYANRMGADKLGRISRESRARESNPKDFIDFCSEQPDAMADLFVIDTLYKEASKWENSGYNAKTVLEFNQSAAVYLEKKFFLTKIDAKNEISVTNGTTSALNLLALGFINRGDASLISKPSVTSLETMTKWLSGTVVDMPLLSKNKFYPKYEDIPQKSLKKAKLLYLSYPNNPTGATATIEFFKETVDFAKLNNLIVVHDAAFASLVYKEGEQLSLMSVDGAKKIGVEIHSLSHGFNMAGWGIGFMVGNKNIIRAFDEVKRQSGLSQFVPIQQAASYALLQTDVAFKTAQKYERRIGYLIKEMVKLGFKVKKPKAGFYLFVKTPKGTECGLKFESSVDFESFLFGKGILAKAFDEGHMRFSVTFSAFGDTEEKQVVAAFYDKLKDYKFIF